MLDFEKYAEDKSMQGAVAQSWIAPFERHFLQQRGDYDQINVLDYGFGDGRYFEYFTRYFKPSNIYGVEVSQVRTERAQARGWQHAVYVNQGDRLPYEDRFFDFVNMVEVIEHIPESSINFYLAEITRVLKPEGVLILTTPNYPIKRAYDLIDAVTFRMWERLKDDPTHVAFYNHKKLRARLSRYFRDLQFYPYKAGRFYKRWRHDLLCHKILAVCSGPIAHAREEVRP